MTTATGRRAEDIAADYLAADKMKILDRNWRNRWCEIDLVARDRCRVVHFVEVKYRRSNFFGSGFDYISQAKSRRLRRAAIAWLSEHQPTADYRIDIIAVSGPLDRPQVERLENALID